MLSRQVKLLGHSVINWPTYFRLWDTLSKKFNRSIVSRSASMTRYTPSQKYSRHWRTFPSEPPTLSPDIRTDTERRAPKRNKLGKPRECPRLISRQWPEELTDNFNNPIDKRSVRALERWMRFDVEAGPDVKGLLHVRHGSDYERSQIALVEIPSEIARSPTSTPFSRKPADTPPPDDWQGT